MTAQLSRERLEKIASWREKFGAGHNVILPAEEAEAMSRMLLAVIDQKPALHRYRRVNVEPYGPYPWSYGEFTGFSEPIEGIEDEYFYAKPPATMALPYREQVRVDHAKWSQETFGNVGPIGPLRHLSKEALEAAAEPGDLSEWADMQFLLWDAQRRAGITDEQIMQAMIDKLEVNKARQWPEPKDGEPRMHIKAAPEQGD